MSRRLSLASLVALVCVAAACGGGSSDKGTTKPSKVSSSPSEPEATTTTVAKIRAPLTGLVTTDTSVATRPALTVKIDNNSAAHPQTGLDLADIVYEEVVECDYTRLAAVFQSRVPPVVGPVRSVRRTDTLLVQPLHGIFAFSGGAPYAIASIATAPVVRLNETTAGNAMFRDSSGGKRAPHNLFASGPRLYEHAPNAEGPPRSVFFYGAAGSAPSTPATHADVGFQHGYAVSWDYDAATKLYKRGIFGRPDILANGPQVAVRNVVVMYVNYVQGIGACSSEGAQADLQSQGQLEVFRGGKSFRGTWRYDSAATTQRLYDANGSPLHLDAGSTWVELPKPSVSVTHS